MSIQKKVLALAIALSCSSAMSTTVFAAETSAEEVMSRPVGAGMFNIRHSFELLYTYDYEYYNYGIMMPGNTIDMDDTFQVTANDLLEGRRLNVSFCYMVKNSISSSSHITYGVTQGTVYPITLTVTTPNGRTYVSNYSATNVSVVSFIPTQAGVYSISITCQQDSLVLTQQTPFGYMAQLVKPNE